MDSDLITFTSFSNWDQTRTITLRNAFARDLTRRFKNLIIAIRQAVVNEDVFGLSPLTLAKIQTPGRKAFAYPSVKDQITAFMGWVDKQIENRILETRAGAELSRAVEVVWTSYYVRLAYEQGIRRARQELIKSNRSIPSLENSGGISGVINNPMNLNKLGLLYSRTFSELKGVTSAMSQQINRVLSQAMTEGKNAKQIARLLVHTIGGPSLELTSILGRFVPVMRRAQMIARTELVRAFHIALINEYRNWGVSGVKIKAEKPIDQNDHICHECNSLEGRTFNLDEIEGMIPLHVG